MRSGSIRIGLGGDKYAYAEADEELLTGLGRSMGVAYGIEWKDDGQPYLVILGHEDKPERWVTIVRGPRGEVQSTSETRSIPFITVKGSKPTVQQPLSILQDSVMTDSAKITSDFWGFDHKEPDPTGPEKMVVKKNWEQSLGLPNWGADGSIKDMAMWLLYLAAAGIAFVAIDFATKD